MATPKPPGNRHRWFLQKERRKKAFANKILNIAKKQQLTNFVDIKSLNDVVQRSVQAVEYVHNLQWRTFRSQCGKLNDVREEDS